jgi:MFS family permease
VSGFVAYSGPRAARSQPATPPSVWHALSHRVFFWLWIAALVSNIGTWMQNVGAAWLMTSLSPSPLLVALIQTASSLPILMLALPAGALADIVDRRKLLIISQALMLAAAGALSWLTILHLTTPILLLVLTFALGLGSALNAPAWQAMIPELVSQDDLTAAIALGGINYNAARAVGPALGGIVVAWAGAGATFALNAASFLAVIAVLYQWERVPHPRLLPAERMLGAMRAGLRYVRYASALRATLVRTAAFTLGGSAVWAVLPLVARFELGLRASGYGLLLACFGIGAIAGGACLPRLAHILSRNALSGVTSAVFATAMLALSRTTGVAAACIVMALGGAGWTMTMSLLNVAAQLSVPAWVQGRALSCYQIVLQGAMAGGSALWGFVAGALGVRTSLLLASIAIVIGLPAMLRFRLVDDNELALDPAPHWPFPKPNGEINPESGPVLVTMEYLIEPERAAEFARAMQPLRLIRLRDGAIFWGLFFDTARPERFVEYFLIESWLEHLRQHERAVLADLDVEVHAKSFHRGTSPPVVSHQISAESIDEFNAEFFARAAARDPLQAGASGKPSAE